jgi:RNA polymerase sigma-70 factor (ECF subfamily)
VNELGTVRPEPLTDADVFREIYPQARRFAAFVAPAGIEPDDLVQDALARVLRGRSLTTLDHPLAYLRTTMLNAARNEHRRQRRERDAFDRLPGAADVQHDADHLDVIDDVVRALQDLPPSTRALVYLVDVEDYPTGEAATVVGLSGPAARARLSRARRLLRRQLTEPGEEL